MLLENISLGKTLDIYVDREGYRYHLVSKVEDTNAKRVCVSAIVANGRAFSFRPEDDIKLICRDGDHMWEWTRVKAGLAKLDGSPVHYFEIADKGRSFNRRNAYRVSLEQELEITFYDVPDSQEKSALVPLIEEEYEAVPEEGAGEFTSFGENPGRQNDKASAREVVVEKRIRLIPQPDAVLNRAPVLVKNISETGMGIYSNCSLKEHDGFAMAIPSPYGNLKVKASVVRVSEPEVRGSKYRFYYGCIYSESDQRLIRYIYDIQRKNIQKQREQRSWNEVHNTTRTK